MTKQYWTGFWNRLPNFLNKMGDLCMKVSMMDYQMRNSHCCHGGSIWNLSGGIYNRYPTGCYGGGNGGMNNYWNTAGMMQSVYGNLDSQDSLSYIDPTFKQGIETALSSAAEAQPSTLAVS